MVNHHMLSYSRTSVKQQTTTFILESLVKFEIYRYQCQRADARRIDQTLSDLDFGTFKLNLATARLELSTSNTTWNIEETRKQTERFHVTTHNCMRCADCGVAVNWNDGPYRSGLESWIRRWMKGSLRLLVAGRH
jgi:hypothetical protein